MADNIHKVSVNRKSALYKQEGDNESIDVLIHYVDEA